MNRWVLKKLLKDVSDGLAEYVKNIKQKHYNIYMYEILMWERVQPIGIEIGWVSSP